MRLLLILVLTLCAGFSTAEQQKLVLASTTSTQNSGLYDYLLPHFTGETGISVQVVAVGTGQALRIARNGDADLLIVHHRASEDQFVAEGFGLKRQDLMYNDFVIVGPALDPAKVSSASSAADAFMRLQAASALFISRGDDSGTHFKERSIWQLTGIAPVGRWYREIGAGMGAALNMASAVDGYVLTDRGTWLSFNNKGNLAVLFEGDPALFNPYSVIVVNPAKHPHVKVGLAQQLSDWLVSGRGQMLIAEYRYFGHQLFCPSSGTAACAAQVPAK